MSLGEDIQLTIPPPGLGRGQLAQFGLGCAFAFLALAAGIAFSDPAWLSLILFLAAAFFAGFAVYGLLRSVMNSTEVRLSSSEIKVTHSFPTTHSETIAADEFEGVYIGHAGAVARGYFAQEWANGRAELVALGARKVLHFGEGLPSEEQGWIRDLVDGALRDDEKDADRDTSDAVLVQPPERFWADLARYAAYSALGALGLLIILVAIKAYPHFIVAALILVGFSVTVAVLGYRNYRLEHVASGWHRAVVKNLATLRRHDFSATDAEGVGRKLPDFPFFGGPRQFYNVSWNPSDPRDLVAFDFTSHGFLGLRDGVGCALTVRALSRELISVRPRLRYGMHVLRQGARVPDEPEFSQVYLITADNEERAARLLGGPVARAISSWGGQGPQPWVCFRGGMVGVSISRREAGNDRTMREFYDYARKVRRAVERRLTELRGEVETDPSASND